jgi:hypothetical protein
MVVQLRSGASSTAAMAIPEEEERHMKKLYAMVMITSAFWLPASHAGEPYAPKVDVPENVSQSSPEYLSVMIINAAQVPDKTVVDIPTYPGARVFQTRNASEMQANDKTYQTLPYIKLLSSDSPETIVGWYKDQLSEYTYEDVFSVAWVFWKGAGEFNGMDIRQRATVQNVGISEAIGAMGYDKIMEGAKSVIEVTYEPK